MRERLVRRPLFQRVADFAEHRAHVSPHCRDRGDDGKRTARRFGSAALAISASMAPIASSQARAGGKEGEGAAPLPSGVLRDRR